MGKAARDAAEALARSLPWVVLIAFAIELSCLWCAHDGFTLTSADDAARLLIADSFGRYGVWPIHWTWPPLPMAVDALLVLDGGDLLPRAVALRSAMIAATAILLARFWTLAFAERYRLPGSGLCIAALWLFSPIDVRLALSGLSEPYLYLFLAIGCCCWQAGERLPPQVRRARLAWLCGAAAAFGLSTWCRYEGGLFAVLLAIRCAARSAIEVRSRAARPWRRSAAELVPLAVLIPFPLAWLGAQALAFGDPLTFLWETRAAIRAEAVAFYGSEVMPRALVLAALGRLWTVPILAAAAIGTVRLAVESRALFGGLVALLALYAAMAMVSFGGRVEFYVNLFGLAVIPLAVKGAEAGARLLCATISRGLPAGAARLLRRSAPALLAAGTLYQVAFADVPEAIASPFGSWLTPAHRDLFARLRRLDAGDRALVLLDPARMSDVDHPWDNLALVLAAPAHVVVVPFEVPLAPRRLSRLPWLAPAEFQHALARAPEEAAAALSPHDFTLVFGDRGTSAAALARGLGAAGFRQVDCAPSGAVVEYEGIRSGTLERAGEIPRDPQ